MLLFWWYNDSYKYWFDNILLDKKSYKHFLIHNIPYRTFLSEKPLRIWFDKINGFVKNYNGIRYLLLSINYEIYDRIKYCKKWN